MPDIDFLSSDTRGDEDKKKDKKDNAKKGMRMHVPEVLPEKNVIKSEKSGFIAGLKNFFNKRHKEDVPEDLLHPHMPEVRVVPPKPITPTIKANIPPVPDKKLSPAPPVAKVSASAIPATSPPKKQLAPAKPSVPPTPPPPPRPPKPPVPSGLPKPSKKEEKGSTLRVSLLGARDGSVMTDLTERARFKTFLIVVIISLVVDGLIYGGILFYKSRVMRNIREISAGVEDLDRKIADAEKIILPAQDFQKLSLLAEQLLDKHLHWTNFLAMLEKRTLTEVQFLNMTGVETGTISTNIYARDYTTLAKQVLMLESDPNIEEVSLSGASAKYQERRSEDGLRTEGEILQVSAALRIRFNSDLLREEISDGDNTSESMQ